MPRYFFHLHRAEERLLDGQGQLLQSADQAWEAAKASARALMAGNPDATTDWSSSRFVVTDISGETILEFPFLEAVEATGERH
jgi:hypothetical protein